MWLGSELLSWPAPTLAQARGNPPSSAAGSAKHEPGQASGTLGAGEEAGRQLWFHEGFMSSNETLHTMPDFAQHVGSGWIIPAAYANDPPPADVLLPDKLCFLEDDTHSPLQQQLHQQQQQQQEASGAASSDTPPRGEAAMGAGSLDILQKWRVQLAAHGQAAGRAQSAASPARGVDAAGEPGVDPLDPWTVKRVASSTSASQDAGEPHASSG